MLDVLLSAMVFGTIRKGAIGEKRLVTVTAPPCCRAACRESTSRRP
jgi:hypothetical protein